MNKFSYYLVEKKYDELTGRVSSSRNRTDGPIRVNSFGMVFMDRCFCGYSKRADYYLLYLVEGRLDVKLPTGNVEMHAGDFVIFPPLYEFRYEEKYGEKMSYYLTHFSGTDTVRFLDKLGFSNLPQIYTVGIVDEIIEEFASMFDSYNRGSLLIQEIIASGFQRVMILFAQKLNEPVKLEPPHNAIYYIKRRLEDPIKVSELARLENLSESRFYTVFKKTTGKSPIDYIIDLRIARACNLLTSMPMLISEVAEAVGFTDNCFFSKEFKKRMGVSPSAFKKGERPAEQ